MERQACRHAVRRLRAAAAHPSPQHELSRKRTPRRVNVRFVQPSGVQQPPLGRRTPPLTRLAGMQRRQRLGLNVLLGDVRLRLARPVGWVWQHVVKGLAPPACRVVREPAPAACDWQERTTEGRMRLFLTCLSCKSPAGPSPCLPGSRSTPICCIHSSLAQHRGSHPTITPLWRRQAGRRGVG